MSSFLPVYTGFNVWYDKYVGVGASLTRFSSKTLKFINENGPANFSRESTVGSKPSISGMVCRSSGVSLRIQETS